MIITPLNVYEPKLEEKLPLNRSFEIKPGITLVVGENESGKTAFLKLLYSSLINSFYFERKKQPYFLREFYSLDGKNIYYNTHCLKEELGILRRLRPNINWECRPGLVGKVKEVFSKDTPQNRFVFFEIDSANFPLFPFMFSSRDPNPDMEMSYNYKIDERRMFRLNYHNEYCQKRSPGYNQLDDVLKFLASVQQFYNQWSKVRFNVSHPMVTRKYEIGIWIENEWLEKMEREKRALDRDTIGKYLHGREIQLDDFEKIDAVMEQSRLWIEPTSLTNLLVGENEVSWYETMTPIPDNAEALVLIDEPTNFMSYKVKYDFLRRLRKVSLRFPYAYILVTTNDGVLIENPVEGWRYLDFNESPVKVKDRVEKPQMG